MVLIKREPPAILTLEDGSVFVGRAFAGRGEVMGEVVFNTGMTGYQEVITDPSYKGQIVTMTYPHVGNTGINDEDMESGGVHLEGFIVRSYHPVPSNWRSRRSLRDFLEAHGKMGVEGMDTRAITRRIRLAGAMRGILTTETFDREELLRRVKAHPGLMGRDLVREVACREGYRWMNGTVHPLTERGAIQGVEGKHHRGRVTEGDGWNNDKYAPRPLYRVVVLDCGVKFNILRLLEEKGCEVVVLPPRTKAEEILSWLPDGVLLSNGPGDPAALPYIVETTKALLGKVPIFGICLGHQILGQAAGGRTEKLKFGHHGINQPVKNVLTGKVEITSQNHGFVVVPVSVALNSEATHENLNDMTSEGLFYRELMAFSVQYHPEAAPGPHDAAYLFDSFVALMEERCRRNDRPAPENVL